jgi:hypothetical protein
VRILVTSAPSCINFGTPENLKEIRGHRAGQFHYVVSWQVDDDNSDRYF